MHLSIHESSTEYLAQVPLEALDAFDRDHLV